VKSGETGTAHLVCGRRAIGNKAEAAVAGDSRHPHHIGTQVLIQCLRSFLFRKLTTGQKTCIMDTSLLRRLILWNFIQLLMYQK